MTLNIEVSQQGLTKNVTISGSSEEIGENASRIAALIAEATGPQLVTIIGGGGFRGGKSEALFGGGDLGRFLGDVRSYKWQDVWAEMAKGQAHMGIDFALGGLKAAAANNVERMRDAVGKAHAEAIKEEAVNHFANLAGEWDAQRWTSGFFDVCLTDGSRWQVSCTGNEAQDNAARSLITQALPDDIPNGECLLAYIQRYGLRAEISCIKDAPPTKKAEPGTVPQAFDSREAEEMETGCFPVRLRDGSNWQVTSFGTEGEKMTARHMILSDTADNHWHNIDAFVAFIRLYSLKAAVERLHSKPYAIEFTDAMPGDEIRIGEEWFELYKSMEGSDCEHVLMIGGQGPMKGIGGLADRFGNVGCPVRRHVYDVPVKDATKIERGDRMTLGGLIYVAAEEPLKDNGELQVGWQGGSRIRVKALQELIDRGVSVMTRAKDGQK